MVPTRWKRVLLADDSPTVQKMTTRLLEGAGYEVMVVANGVAAVEATQQETFDLVLMDLEMPEMGGLEATRAIRQTCPAQSLPIIGVSGSTEPLIRDLCESAGMNALMSKPFRLETLQILLARPSDRSLAESA